MADSLFVQTKAAVCAALRALPLTGFTVYPRIYPDMTNVQFPCVMVTSEGMPVRKAPECDSTEHRGFHYYLRLWIADRKSQQDYLQESLIVNAVDIVYDAFDEMLLPAVPAVRQIRIIPDVLFVPQIAEPDYQFLHSNLQLDIIVVKPRQGS